MLSRRKVLIGLLAAPAIVRASSLMTISPLPKINPYLRQAALGGWLPCDGRAVDRRLYSDLFNIVGKRYGGDLNTFNLPDLRNRVVQGEENTAGYLIRASGKEDVFTPIGMIVMLVTPK